MVILFFFFKQKTVYEMRICDWSSDVCPSHLHFGLAFRQSTGHPPHRYVIMRRIERAKALLLTSQASVTQIAHATGFSSHGHFTAHFRRLVGTTPSRFRLNRL